jgi:hypothetical protein
VTTVKSTLLLTIGTAACSTPTAGDDVPAYAAVTQDDPRFENTFRHEFADVDGVRMHYVTGGSGTRPNRDSAGCQLPAKSARAAAVSSSLT